MKSFFVVLLLAVVVALCFSPQATIAVGDEVLVIDALRLLELKYEAQTGEAAPIPDAAAVLIKDEKAHFSDLKDRAKDLGMKKEDVAWLEGHAFIYCLHKQAPVFIRPQSARWVAIRSLTNSDRVDATARLAAALDHELVFHTVLKKDNELQAMDFEAASYRWFAEHGKAGENLDAQSRYLSFLGSLREAVLGTKSLIAAND